MKPAVVGTQVSDAVAARVVIGRVGDRHVLLGQVDVGAFMLGLRRGDLARDVVCVAVVRHGGRELEGVEWSMEYMKYRDGMGR